MHIHQHRRYAKHTRNAIIGICKISTKDKCRTLAIAEDRLAVHMLWLVTRLVICMLSPVWAQGKAPSRPQELQLYSNCTPVVLYPLFLSPVLLQLSPLAPAMVLSYLALGLIQLLLAGYLRPTLGLADLEDVRGKMVGRWLARSFTERLRLTRSPFFSTVVVNT